MNPKRPGGLVATKPTAAQPDPADTWVQTRGHAEPEAPKEPEEPMIRMTFDLKKSKHRAFARAALQHDKKLTVVLREFIDRYIEESEQQQ